MQSRNPYAEKRRSNQRRDQVLRALATTGDLAINALFKLVSIPFELAQMHVEVARFGMSADMSKIHSFEEVGIFRDIAEMRIYVRNLKRQGLLIEKQSGSVAITQKGRRFMFHSTNHPSFARRYEIMSAAPKVLTMVIFDIPEDDHGKRDWLRFQLKSLGFRRVQGSVWLNQYPLPEALLYDLKKYNLLRHIHLFNINRSGTMSNLIEKFGFEEDSIV